MSNLFKSFLNVDQVQNALKVAMKHTIRGRRANVAQGELMDVAVPTDQPPLPAAKKKVKALADAEPAETAEPQNAE